MSITRRPHLLGPGTALLLADTSLFAPQRLSRFAADSGISSDSLLISPLCPTPLPIYNFASLNPGSRRWPGTRPEMMWHPLMWLPNRVAGRYTYPDDITGEPVRESDEVWIIRVALELEASGLYDAESATWLDVLSEVGIDITNDFDLGRIEEWLDGSPDTALDGIDLSPHFLNPLDPAQPHDWALADALTLLEPVRESSWALTADEIFSEASRLRQPDPATNLPLALTDVHALATALCATSVALLGEVPMSTDSGVSTSPTAEGHGAFFMRAYSALLDNGSDATLHDQVLEALADRCYTMREAYWPVLESLHAAPPQEVTS